MGAEAAAGDLLRRGREALAAADWDVARACFDEALAIEESPEALDGPAQAAHYLGDYDRAIELGERAFAAHRGRGAAGDAARVARWLAFFYFAVHANLAAAMARAESLLEGAEESVDHGWLALDRAPWSSDATERSKHAMAALTIARRFGDRDLAFGAIALLGETYVAAGRVAEGMTLLDEAMAAVSGGEVQRPRPAGSSGGPPHREEQER
jgi:tetratricopeptide (TPR) repeat protein